MMEAVLLLAYSWWFCLPFLDRQTYCYWVWWPRIYLWRVLDVCTRPSNKCKYFHCYTHGFCLEGKLFVPWSRIFVEEWYRYVTNIVPGLESWEGHLCWWVSGFVLSIVFKLWLRLVEQCFYMFHNLEVKQTVE